MFSAISRAVGVNLGSSSFAGSAVIRFSWRLLLPCRVPALIVVRCSWLFVRALREWQYRMSLQDAHTGYEYAL